MTDRPHEAIGRPEFDNLVEVVGRFDDRFDKLDRKLDRMGQPDWKGQSFGLAILALAIGIFAGLVGYFTQQLRTSDAVANDLRVQMLAASVIAETDASKSRHGRQEDFDIEINRRLTDREEIGRKHDIESGSTNARQDAEIDSLKAWRDKAYGSDHQ